MEKTFEYQENLPIMQIPELDQSCKTFLEWVEPLLTKEQFIKTKKVVQQFRRPDGEGIILQKKLHEFREKNNFANWTIPFWENVYLQPRIPLIVEGNVFYLLQRKENVHLTQSELASQVILSALQFKFLIDEEQLPVDKTRENPLCMEQYKYFFSSTRIPGKEKDTIQTSSAGNDIIVFFKGNIYAVHIYDTSGQLKSYSQFIQELEIILNEKEKGQGIGALTSMERNQWADSRKELLKLSPENKGNLEILEKGIFALCLDENSPESLEEKSRQMLYGNGQDRWFDKSIQFIITPNGHIGINMEHTKIDGSPMSNFIKHLYHGIQDRQKLQVDEAIHKPKKLIFTLNKNVKSTIGEANHQFEDVIANTKTRVMIFNEFGINQIKQWKVSPDALVQIALQMAQYKLFNKFYSQYEAVMTRGFLHGRIEVMYSVTNEAAKFIKSMMDSTCDDNTKRELFKKATEKHIERIRDCQKGEGIDTHLMALLHMYEKFEEEMKMTNIPELFVDEGYKTLTYSTLCTSTTSAEGLELGGWGPVVEDGFAIRYIKDRDQIRFHFMNNKSTQDQLERFIAYTKESLIEIFNLLTEK